MFDGAYRKRLEADLLRWVGTGRISPDVAGAVRFALAGDERGSRLPATFAMLGVLLLAAGVSAFIAANWQDIPRLVKLAMVAGLLLSALGAHVVLLGRGMRGGAEAAATFAVLVFGAGVALVGQMYHLPADWPGGALLVALGALAVAALLVSDGALIVALVAMCVWTWGRSSIETGNVQAGAHFAFLLAFVPAGLLALGRSNAMVHRATILALGLWLLLAVVPDLNDKRLPALIAYGMGLSALFTLIGSWAMARGGPGLLASGLGLGAGCFAIALCLETVRVLDASLAKGGQFMLAAGLACGAAVLAAALHAMQVQGRIRLVLPAAILLGLVVPLLFWAGFGHGLLGRILISSLLLASSIGLIAAGVMSGLKVISSAGYAAFAVIILILLYRTVGSLLDQSFFFFGAGIALVALAAGSRKLLARLSALADGNGPVDSQGRVDSKGPAA